MFDIDLAFKIEPGGTNGWTNVFKGLINVDRNEKWMDGWMDGQSNGQLNDK